MARKVYYSASFQQPKERHPCRKLDAFQVVATSGLLTGFVYLMRRRNSLSPVPLVGGHYTIPYLQSGVFGLVAKVRISVAILMVSTDRTSSRRATIRSSVSKPVPKLKGSSLVSAAFYEGTENLNLAILTVVSHRELVSDSHAFPSLLSLSVPLDFSVQCRPPGPDLY